MADGLLDGFTVTIDVPVAWGEMDAFGHVNNIFYFRYFESARIAYLHAIGLTGSEQRDDGRRVGPILHSTHCRFRLPLQFPDTVRVGGRAADVADDRFTMEYRIVSTAMNAIAAEGGGVIVAYDYERATKAALPPSVRARIRELDGI
jgi:acyl-CoA thioester hydrolase